VLYVMSIVAKTMAPLNFSSPASLALYLALTLLISTLSFHFFEAPARESLRRWAFARPLTTVNA
jgi:peptidoglycan/LPS O-acetylase OafA/YrhL